MDRIHFLVQIQINFGMEENRKVHHVSGVSAKWKADPRCMQIGSFLTMCWELAHYFNSST